MTGPRIPAPGWGVMTKESFAEWLAWFQSREHYDLAVQLRGKPRVRVPVERQTPNEADL